MPHQKEGLEWLKARSKAMLAWDMRCGKTATALSLWGAVGSNRPCLVICPATAREQWRREALRFLPNILAPGDIQAITSKYDRIMDSHRLVICNYDRLSQPHIRAALRGRRWGTLILDEAHYLKSPNAERTKHVFGGLAKGVQPLIDFADDRVIELTGTPMPNHPGELWTHARALYPESILYRGKPMELWQFELRYCQLAQTEHGMKVVGGKNLQELKQALTPFIHRVKYEDVFGEGSRPAVHTWPLTFNDGQRGPLTVPDLPELVAKLSQRFGEMPNIEQFDDKMVDAYLQTINAYHDALASIRRDTGTLKAVATALLVREELEQGCGKTIIFAWHRDAIETLARALKAFNPAIVHGAVDAGRRVVEIDRFNNDPTCKVFIGNILAAGQAIDLSGGRHIVFAEASWSPGENNQAMMRASGVNHCGAGVDVRFVYLPGSVDEQVTRALARKTAIINQVVG
jgi:SNF2 family DNA or RNA helicase